MSPRFAGENQGLIKGIPTAKIAPPNPRNAATNNSCEKSFTKVKPITGSDVNKQTTENIILPPNLSVSIPSTILPSDPIITGTAKSNDSLAGSRESSAAYFTPSGLSKVQAQKLIIKASVANVNAKYASFVLFNNFLFFTADFAYLIGQSSFNPVNSSFCLVTAILLVVMCSSQVKPTISLFTCPPTT